MLTGIETAGLTLAIFPVAVHALQAWVDGLRTLQRFRRTRRELENYAQVLSWENVLFLNTLETLLTDLVHPDHLRPMIEEPNSVHWSDWNYEIKLKARLDRSYEVFFQTIRTLLHALQNFREKLRLLEDGSTSWAQMSRLKQKAFSAKITFDRHHLQDELAAIGRANSFLSDSTTQWKALEPSRGSRKTNSIAKIARTRRENAADLHDCITSSWKCECRTRHFTSLHIGHLGNETANSCNFELQISWSDATKSVPSSEAARWYGIEVRSVKTAKATFKMPLNAPKSAQSQTKVRFQEDVSISDALSAITLDEGPTGSALAILDLCHFMALQRSEESTQGFLSMSGCSSAKSEVRHDLHVAEGRSEDEVDITSLSKALAVDSNGEAFALSRLHRLQLAIDLVMGIVQFDATPWLSECWSSSDIILQRREVVSAHRRSNKQEFGIVPCLLHDPAPSTQDQKPLSQSGVDQHFIRNQSLLQVAFVLIELSLHRTLEDLYIDKDDDVADPNKRKVNTAFRVLDDVYNESGGNYGDVVQRCLRCLFDLRDVTFENDDFVQAFYESVVNPLMQDLKVFRSMKL